MKNAEKTIKIKRTNSYDKVTSVNGRDYERFSDILSPEVLMGSNNYFTVQRGNEELRIELPNDFIEKFSGKNAPLVISPRNPFTVGSVASGSNAEKGGLLAGDRFLSINGNEIKSPFVHVITCKDGRWFRFRDFMNTAVAQEAFDPK